MKPSPLPLRLIVLLCLLLTAAPAAAQDAAFVPYQRFYALLSDPLTQPLDIFHRSDLYSWAPGENAWSRETYYGYNYPPVLSPDGRWLVYQSLPQEFVDSTQRGDFFGGGPFPTNLWLMDLSVPPGDPARSLRIADQVTGRPSDDDGDDWARRSQPVWSPDSARLAWVELDYLNTAFSGRIKVYDTRTGTTTLVTRGVSLGFADAGEWQVPDLRGWGSAMLHITDNAGVYDLPGNSFGSVANFVDDSGVFLRLPVSYFASFEDRLTWQSWRWVAHGETWALALHYTVTGWVVLEPYSGTFQLLANPPFTFAATGARWTGQITGWEQYQPPTMDWRLGDVTVSVDTAPGELMTFTPDGAPIWVSHDNALTTLAQDGALTPFALPDLGGLTFARGVWTPGVWLTDGQGTPIEPQIVP